MDFLKTRLIDPIRVTLSPLSLVPTLLNLLFYFVVQTVFFWFVASNTVLYSVSMKSEVMIDFALSNPHNYSLFKKWVESDDPAMVQKAAEENAAREKVNLELLKKWIAPAIVAALALLLLTLIRVRMKGENLDRIDGFIIGLVIFAFTTELYFYFFVIRRQILISDNDMLLAAFRFVA